MSSRNHRLTLSPEARKDFRDILSYTEQTWGSNQVLKYRNILDATLETIMQHPESGKPGMPPYFCLRASKHYVFYRIEDDTIRISRILHEKMDFSRHLN